MTFFRLYSLMTIMTAIDGTLSYVLIGHWLQNGPTVRVLFLTEYLIMCVRAISVTMRLNFHAYNLYRQRKNEAMIRQRRRQERLEQRRAANNEQMTANNEEEDDMDVDGDIEVSGWENHNVSIFYLDIATDLLQSGIYIAFFLIIMSKYGLPIHLLRDIYMAIRSAKKRITDLMNYRRLVRNLDQRFPDATPEELSGGPLCVVCREELRTSVKKLPCGHLFHVNCLRGWLEQTQECPTCRAPVDQTAYDNYLRERNPQQQQSAFNATQVPPAAASNTPTTQQQQQASQQSPVHEPVPQPQVTTQQQQQQQLEYLRSMEALLRQATRATNPMSPDMMFSMFQPSMMNQPTASTSNVGASSSTSTNSGSSIEQQQEMMLDGALRQTAAQKIMTEMYVQYLENSRRIIDLTLERLKALE